MSSRLIYSIVTTILEEVAIVAIARFVLPAFGFRIPVVWLIAIMLAWFGQSVLMYRLGSQALRRKLIESLPGMVGSRGMVITPLFPDGWVRIKGELWKAQSKNETIDVGEEVIVTGQEGLKLTVQRLDGG